MSRDPFAESDDVPPGDFSAAMHDLAREHLGDLASRVTFVQRTFAIQRGPKGSLTFMRS